MKEDATYITEVNVITNFEGNKTLFRNELYNECNAYFGKI